jgi:hypothetical protein
MASESPGAGGPEFQHPDAATSAPGVGLGEHTVVGSPAVPSLGSERLTILEALPAYDVVGELGRGGSGVVLEGRHRHLGREVAIK